MQVCVSLLHSHFFRKHTIIIHLLSYAFHPYITATLLSLLFSQSFSPPQPTPIGYACQFLLFSFSLAPSYNLIIFIQIVIFSFSLFTLTISMCSYLFSPSFMTLLATFSLPIFVLFRNGISMHIDKDLNLSNGSELQAYVWFCITCIIEVDEVLLYLLSRDYNLLYSALVQYSVLVTINAYTIRIIYSTATPEVLLINQISFCKPLETSQINAQLEEVNCQIISKCVISVTQDSWDCSIMHTLSVLYIITEPAFSLLLF